MEQKQLREIFYTHCEDFNIKIKDAKIAYNKKKYSKLHKKTKGRLKRCLRASNNAI